MISNPIKPLWVWLDLIPVEAFERLQVLPPCDSPKGVFNQAPSFGIGRKDHRHPHSRTGKNFYVEWHKDFLWLAQHAIILDKISYFYAFVNNTLLSAIFPFAHASRSAGDITSVKWHIKVFICNPVQKIVNCTVYLGTEHDGTRLHGGGVSSRWCAVVLLRHLEKLLFESVLSRISQSAGLLVEHSNQYISKSVHFPGSDLLLLLFAAGTAHVPEEGGPAGSDSKEKRINSRSRAPKSLEGRPLVGHGSGHMLDVAGPQIPVLSLPWGTGSWLFYHVVYVFWLLCLMK